MDKPFHNVRRYSAMTWNKQLIFNTGTHKKTKCNIFKGKNKTYLRSQNACYSPGGMGEHKTGPTLIGGGIADGNLICASPPYLKFICTEKVFSHFYT